MSYQGVWFRFGLWF